MVEKPHVTTAEELDAMTPTERQEHFLASVVKPADMSPTELAAAQDSLDRLVGKYESRQQRAS